MDAKEVISYRMPLALTPEMMEAVSRYAEDSKNWSFGVGKAAIMRSLILFALEQKGYWPPASAAKPASAALQMASTALQADSGEIVLDPANYERYAPHRREEMMQKDREWMAKNGRPA